MQPQNEQILDQWESIKKNFETSITKMFPITGKKNTMEIGNLTFDESKAHPSDIKSQELHKHAEKTWGIPVYADFTLKDKNTGQVIDRSKQKIAVMPRLTQRETYIVSGGEYNSAYQWRLKSGIYSQIKENGKYETVFNLNGAGKDFAKEQRLKIPFDEETRAFKFKYGTVAAPLYSILKAADVSDEAMKAAWGEDIYKANYKKNWEQDVTKLYNNKLKKRGLTPASDSFLDLKEAIKKELNKAEVLPETTKLTLGKEYKELSGQALLDGSVHIMRVAKGEKKPDDVYSLYFKHLLGLDDFIGEKFGDSKTAQKIKFKIKNNLDRKDSINQVIQSDLFSKPLGQVFYGNSLSQRPDQTNPLDMLSSANLTTIKGPGGISSEHAIRNSMKIVSQSHLGMLDPLLTPEGSETGISLHLPIGVRKIGREARTFVYNIPEAKFQYINPAQLHGDLTVTPDQIKWKDGKPIPHKDVVTMLDPRTHEFTERPFSEAKYVLPSAKNLFSEATNLIPFLQCNQGNRTMTGSRQPSQGVSLLHREAPLVQVQSNNSKSSFEDIYGKQFSHQSPVDGKIVDIEKDNLGNTEALHIKSGNETFRAQIYNHFPLNDKKAFLHATPTVAIGDEVKKGQQIADTNFSKNGTLAVGTNLRCGYFPYSSLTYEDSIVISEDAAKKLSSEHLHKTSIDIDPKNDKVSLSKFLSHISSAGKKLKKDKVETIGEDGIIKPGSIVKPGDLLVTAVSKNSLDASLSMMSSRMKGAITPYKDKSLVWDHDYEGKVIKVIPKPGNKGYTVYVKTVEPAQVGDKVSARHGDKNIIGAILPMDQTPYTINEKGEKEHIDLITAPSGVVSRINVGQLMEMAASKIALKTGKPYITNNFAGPNMDYAEKIRKELKEHNIKDQEIVHDPVLGKTLDSPVLVGHKYIMKLKHQVEKKESVRGLDQAVAGKYTINLDPQRGKGEGAQAISQLDLYALLAHGARENLKEMSSYKAELQHDPKTMTHTDDDFWNRVMVGMPLPAPKSTFAYRKFEGYLTGLGLNLHKTGHETILTPLTDKGTLAQSNGEIKDAQQVRGKDDKEIPGGLFDVKTTGGIPNGPRKGLFWTHYNLAEPYPNPLFVGAKKLPGPAVVLSGLNYGDFSKVVTGEKTVEVGGKTLTGGKAIEELLKKVDVKKELQSTIESLPSLKGAQRNQANKKAKFLQALTKLNMRPEDAYIMNHIPILPPIFRPLVQTPSGEVANADITELYKHLIINSNQLKDKEIANIPEEAGKLRAAIWDNLKAITGLGKVPTYDGNRKYKGILQNIAGDSPKTGFFQHKVMKRRQELSMRSTVIPGVDMGIDEVGIPRGAAMELYKPFIVRELVRSGKDLIEAKREVKENTPLAHKALDSAIKTRPVLVKRDPVLHKYNIMAYKPKLIEGQAISMHPLNCALGNLDFDGNCYIGSIEILVKYWYNTLVTNEQTLQEKYNMKFTNTTRVVATTNDGLLINMKIEDMPRLLHTKTFDRNGASVYEVPEGFSIWSYDHNINSPVFAPITHITIEENFPTVNVDTRRFNVTASINESLCVYDHDSEEIRDICPKDALGRLCPVMAEIPHFGTEGNFEIGWLIGAFVSDGSIANKVIHYSKVSKDHRDRFYNALSLLQAIPVIRHTYEELHGEENAIQGKSIKDHFSRLESHVVELMNSCYSKEVVEGRSCLRKQLPDYLGSYSKETLLGILAGLFDGNGSLSVSYSKTKPQPIANYATSSKFLVNSLETLSRLLGIRTSVSTTEPKEGRLQTHTSYTVNFSINDLAQYANDLRVIGEKAASVLALIGAEKRRDIVDIVPVPNFIMNLISKRSGPMGSHPLAASIKTIKNARKAGYYLSRTIAETVLTVLEGANVPGIEKWREVVLARNVHWDYVISVTNNKPETVYDLVVPTTKVFVVNGGLVVWDTMAVYLPLTESARQEALDKMLPSKNLFSSTNYGIMHAPDHEAIIGLNMLSGWGKSTGKTYKSMGQLLADKTLKIDDVVKVGDKDTTRGRALLAEHVPTGMDHSKLLHDPGLNLKKGNIHGLLEDYARKDPQGYPTLVDDWRRKGSDVAHSAGFSFSMNDLKPMKEKREAILAPYHEEAAKIWNSKLTEAEKESKVVDLYNDATTHLVKDLTKEYTNNNIFKMVDTKARGKIEQFRQTVIAPMLLVDSTNRTIPTPVTKSYSEGLNVAQYWTTLHGARKGTLQRAQGTSVPGALAKEIVNLNVSTPIVKHDCGTEHGVHIDLVGKNGKDEEDIMDRYLAKDTGDVKKGTLITPEIFSKFKKDGLNSVEVRSPITCKVPQGICSKCFGLNETGHDHEIGTNIGVIASQAVSEPVVQLAMDAFHSGGVSQSRGGGSVSRLERLGQLLNIPKNLPGSATLSKTSGTVHSIEKDPSLGGHNVFVKSSSGLTKHYVPHYHETIPAVGDEVKKGDSLSTGPINPNHLLALKDMNHVRKYLADELGAMYKDVGGVRRRNVEVLVRNLTNMTEVVEPGSSEHLPGDILTSSVIEAHNSTVKNPDDRILHKPILKGIKETALIKDEDYLSRMNFQRIQNTLIEAAGKGWRTRTSNTLNPIGAWAASSISSKIPGKAEY